MKMLYISLWSIESGLSRATVLPVIDFLLENKIMEQITFFSPESRKKKVSLEPRLNFVWHPVYFTNEAALSTGWKLLVRMLYAIFVFLVNHSKEIDVVWARASIAGGIAAIISKLFNKPFGVESFEPHANYMTESGAWRKDGLKNRIQTWFENLQLSNAWRLITVSAHFQHELLRNKKFEISKVFNIACCADFDLFRFDIETRTILRNRLSIADDKIVGVYVGKFGDIYYDKVFFHFLSRAFESGSINHMIFLSPMTEHVRSRIIEFSIPAQNCTIKQVDHHEVSTYLNAADIGFCPVKESPSKKHCSPIKTAEYFACGLPVIISRNIGDDSDFVSSRKFGLVVDFENHDGNFSIPQIDRNTIRESVILTRNSKNAYSTYLEVFS